MKPRLALLCFALIAALGAGIISWRDMGPRLAVMEACDAAQAERWQDVLDLTDGLVGPDATGRAAAECRCHAELATGRGDECAATLETLIVEDDGAWAPSPTLSVHLIQTLRDAGRSEDAARIAAQASRAHPEQPDLFYLQLVTRSSVEDEAKVLEELTGRIAAKGSAAARMRVSVANRHLMRGDPPAALTVLGDTPPDDAGHATGLWFDTRGMAHAANANLAGVDETYAHWRAAGGDPHELDARYALTLSIGKIEGSEPTLDLLERAVANGPYDAKLEEPLIIRLVLALAINGRSDEALAAFDLGRERYALDGLTREELLRSAAQRRRETQDTPGAPSRIHFTLSEPRPGAELWVSPTGGAPIDSAYQRLEPHRPGEWEITRSSEEARLRWVLRGTGAEAFASGTLTTAAGVDLPVEIQPRTSGVPTITALARRRADGDRRVALILLDCGDWRIVQYLRARGEIPVLDNLLARGHRAVLDSDPPLTAAALEALVWPKRSASPSFVGLVHRFGLELAGLSSIGDNPLAALEWILPETPDLFGVIGAGEYTAANLLFAHGGIAAGRHGETTGPNGQKRQLEFGAAARDLTAEERAKFPTLAAVRKERDAVHLRTIAAEFDSAEDILRDGEVDLLAMRIEALDILTHAHFASTTRDGQDDGAGLLYAVYRYIDARLGALHNALDEDDVLVVMSDHGIRTSMEHSREAMFVAVGGGIAPGRADGSPALRGVARSLADLMAVPNDWPDTGVGPAAAALARAR